jgi:transcriptional regulator with XRE-family HTH domain
MSETPSFNDVLAAEIRAELARRNMSHSDFAKQAGWSAPYFSRRMNGEVPFDADEIDVIALELGMRRDQLTNPVRR